jgi:hypothetical protein
LQSEIRGGEGVERWRRQGHQVSARSFVGPWWPGTLLRYESMSALGAKYCWFNAIHPSKFVEVVAEFMPASTTGNPLQVDAPLACAVDAPGFRLAELAVLLGERLQVLQSQSLAALSAADAVASDDGRTMPLLSPFWTLRGCAVCLAKGYHSVVHQIAAIERCHIHPHEHLKEHPSRWSLEWIVPRQYSLDLRHVGPLYDLWFGPEAGHPLDGVRAKLSAEELERGERALRRVRRLTALAGGQAADAAVTARTLPDAEAVQTRAAPHQSRKKNLGQVRLRSLLGSQWASMDGIRASVENPAATQLFGKEGQEWLKYFCLARLVSVVRGDPSDPPEWLAVARRNRRRILEHHQPCESAVRRLIGSLEHTIAVGVLARVTPPREGDAWPPRLEDPMLDAGVLPCRRLLTLRWWDEIFGPDGEALSAIADGLVQGCYSPSHQQPLDTLVKALADSGLCTPADWRLRESDRQKWIVSRMSLAWSAVIGIEQKVYSWSRASSAAQLFTPSGALAEVADNVLLAATRTVLWVLSEVEQEVDGPQMGEPPQAARATPALVERLTKSAPHTVMRLDRSVIAVSSFCRCPPGTPGWREPNGSHVAATERGVEKLEGLLRQIAAERRLATRSVQQDR